MISEPVPQAISQLKLRYAFLQHNPPILTCIDSSTDANTMVIDDEELFYSHFTDQEDQEYRCVIVNNVEGHEIFLLAIDNKFISNYPGGIADCALFDESLFNFVEFKTNAEGHTTAQVEETYRNAMAQIDNTYRLFKTKLSEVGVDFVKVVNIQCYIVVSSRFPRESAIEQQLQVEFAQSLHLDLSFENVIEFK